MEKLFTFMDYYPPLHSATFSSFTRSISTFFSFTRSTSTFSSFTRSISTFSFISTSIPSFSSRSFWVERSLSANLLTSLTGKVKYESLFGQINKSFKSYRIWIGQLHTNVNNGFDHILLRKLLQMFSLSKQLRLCEVLAHSIPSMYFRYLKSIHIVI